MRIGAAPQTVEQRLHLVAGPQLVEPRSAHLGRRGHFFLPGLGVLPARSPSPVRCRAGERSPPAARRDKGRGCAAARPRPPHPATARRGRCSNGVSMRAKSSAMPSLTCAGLAIAVSVPRPSRGGLPEEGGVGGRADGDREETAVAELAARRSAAPRPRWRPGRRWRRSPGARSRAWRRSWSPAAPAPTPPASRCRRESRARAPRPSPVPRGPGSPAALLGKSAAAVESKRTTLKASLGARRSRPRTSASRRLHERRAGHRSRRVDDEDRLARQAPAAASGASGGITMSSE